MTNLKGLVTSSSPLSFPLSLSDMVAGVYGACSVLVRRQWQVVEGRDEVRLSVTGDGLTSPGALSTTAN